MVFQLFQSQKHYTALVCPENGQIPANWSRETPNTVIDLEGGTRNVAASSAFASPMRTPGTPSVCTPSVQDESDDFATKAVSSPSCFSNSAQADLLARAGDNGVQAETEVADDVRSCLTPSVCTVSRPERSHSQATPSVHTVAANSAFSWSHVPWPAAASTAGVKRRLVGKQQVWEPPADNKVPTWTCPVCGFQNFNAYGAKSAAKIHHFKHAHPDIPKHIYAPGLKTAPFEASPLIPAAQRDWSCVLCDYGLPTLAPAERLRAIKKHIKDHHPEETCRSMVYKRQIGRPPPPSFGAKMTDRVAAARKKMYPTRNLILLISQKRGYPCRNFICPDCFSVLGSKTGSAKPDATCKQRQKEMQANGFVLARKRYWWNNLVSKTPHLADEFLKKAQLARKTVEETLKVGVETESTIRWKKILTDRANAKSSKPSSSSSVKSSRPKGKKRPVAKVQLKPKARPTKGQLAKNRHGGKRGVRVGEASHPGPTNLKVVTLNTQSSSNTWAFLHQVLTGSDIDVALLQEVSFNPSEAAAFSRYLRKKEFSFYYQKGSPNRRQGNGCSGGVGLLVRKTLPQRFAFADGDQEAQSLFVWVGGVLFGSIYAPPTEESPARAAAMFLDALISCNVQASATWCVGGDFNEVPSHSHFEDVAGAMHGSVCGLGAPTRWDGNREIDFFLVNCPDLASAVSSLALKLSDHKILQMQLAVSVQSPTTASLQKGPDLTKPTHVESEQWREVVEKAWEQTTQDIKGVASPFAECTVQEHWERIQALFRQTYQHAFRQVAVRHSEKKLALKGQNANVKWRSQAARGPRPENGHRKVRRKLARWYELRRFLMRDPSQLTAAQTIEFQNLLKKLDLAETGPPPLREVQARIDAISSLLGQAEKQAKESNIRQWRLRMQNVASLSRWLKSKQNPSHCVVTGTDNVVDGATAIFQFWHDFWRDLDAGRPAFADRVSTALAGIPQDLPALQWNCPNGVQLMATAQGCRGAAGADGWTADEIRYLPLDAFNLVANFFERCVAEGELPSQFFEARMVCIPKAAKITDYQIHVDQCRPITILSVFWRLWISTICKSPEMKNWIDAVIHPSINGLGEETCIPLLPVFLTNLIKTVTSLVWITAKLSTASIPL